VPAVTVESAYKQLICAVTAQATALHHSLVMLNALMVFAGHPDFHVHSGESAIIVPRAVTGLGRRQVAVVAVAKHHTAVATTSCELFTWGSNRDGRLGYAAVDTQPTPRKYGCIVPTHQNSLVPLVFRRSSTYMCFCPCMHVCSNPSVYLPAGANNLHSRPLWMCFKDHTVGIRICHSEDVLCISTTLALLLNST